MVMISAITCAIGLVILLTMNSSSDDQNAPLLFGVVVILTHGIILYKLLVDANRLYEALALGLATLTAILNLLHSLFQ
jgi:hypothetical protein